MNKKIFSGILTLLIFTMTGCGLLQGEEAESQTSSTQGNVLESVFLSEDHFELREEEITIEYGTPLSEDLSQYVIAKDYEGITCQYEEIPRWDYEDGKTGTAVFTNENFDHLYLTIHYTDTTAPTIERTEYTYYTLVCNRNGEIRDIPGTYSQKEEIPTFAFDDIKNFYGINDNVYLYIDSITVNGITYEATDDVYGGSFTYFPTPGYGEHTIIITTHDKDENNATFECSLNIVMDMSPENFEEYTTEYQYYTEQELQDAIEEYINNN